MSFCTELARQFRELATSLRQRHVCPTKKAGRLAFKIMLKAAPTCSSDAPLRCVLRAGATGGSSTSSSSWKMLYGTSTCTGPGRPDNIVVAA
jgi:hypothetical protein